jgi:retron-type reverse transcriptase
MPGPDGETLDQFAAQSERNLLDIQEGLKSKRYSFGPYWERPVPKLGGGQRLVGRFNIRDKIVFRAMHQVITPLFDKNFSDSLVSYRKGLGAWESALNAMRIAKREKKLWVFRSDVRSYAETFDFGVLREQIRQSFKDEPGIARLLFAFLAQQRIVDGIQGARQKGCPQGSELTTFFYNFYLKDLDHLMVDEGFRYSRYSDDIIVWGRSHEESISAKKRVEEFVKKMKLELHPGKTFLVTPDEPYDYLGYTFRGDSITISDKSFEHLTSWVRRVIKKGRYQKREMRRLSEAKALRAVIEDFQSGTNVQRVVSWLRYFQRITDPSQIQAADKMIRERILACATGRVSRGNYRLLAKRNLNELGLHSLAGLHYRMSNGHRLPVDIERKLEGKVLFNPGKL